MQQHIAARQCSPGFDKAQMPGRDSGLAGEVELAHAAALTPLAQMSANGLALLGHAGIIKDRRTRLNYLERNRPAARSAQNSARTNWGAVPSELDPMLSLDREVAIITGGTSGIGARTAALFVEKGARVVIAGRRRERGEQLARTLGEFARFVPTDVAAEADVKAMIEQTIAWFGTIAYSTMPGRVRNGSALPRSTSTGSTRRSPFTSAALLPR